MAEIWDLSTTDASNNDSAFGFPEGMNPSDVNDNLRRILGALARYYGDTNGALVSAGTGSAYTLASNRSLSTSYSDGQVFVFQANAASANAATLNVDGKGAKVILKRGTKTVSASDILADQIVAVAYEANNDKWQMLSPISGAGEVVGGAASTTEAGFVELATAAETKTGTDSTRAVTPDSLHKRKTIDAATGDGSPGDTSENDLKSATIPAGALAADGDQIHFVMNFRCAANATTKKIRVYFGTTVLCGTGDIALNGNNIIIEGWVIRTGAATQVSYIHVTSGVDGATLSSTPVGMTEFSAATETLANALTLKASVTLGAGAALNDVIQDNFYYEVLKT